jgi:hypothetical protein
VALAKNFTVLTKMNYYDSAALMHVMLHARGLWAAMTEGTILHGGLDGSGDEYESGATGVAGNDHEQAIGEGGMGGGHPVERGGRSCAKGEGELSQEGVWHDHVPQWWVNLRFHHADRKYNQPIAVLGFEYKEEEIVRKFFQALLPRFEQIAASIKTLLNLETVMVDELVGRLKPSEESINRNGGGAIVSRNLTKDELITKIMLRLKIIGGVTPYVTETLIRVLSK